MKEPLLSTDDGSSQRALRERNTFLIGKHVARSARNTTQRNIKIYFSYLQYRDRIANLSCVSLRLHVDEMWRAMLKKSCC